MRGMAGRIERVRGELRASLESKYPDKDWSFITKQIGMFSFTGLTPPQASCQLGLHLPARTCWRGFQVQSATSALTNMYKHRPGWQAAAVAAAAAAHSAVNGSTQERRGLVHAEPFRH